MEGGEAISGVMPLRARPKGPQVLDTWVLAICVSIGNCGTTLSL